MSLVRVLLIVVGGLCVALGVGPVGEAGAQTPGGGGGGGRGLCDKCSELAVIANVGTCKDCGGYTSSGAYSLCGACALKRGICMGCGAPLPAAALVPAAGAAVIRIATRDRWTLTGTLLTPAVAAPRGVVILLHMLNRTRADWNELAPALQAAGFAVLSIDLRGHGQSLQVDGKERTWQGFAAADFEAMRADVAAAKSYAAERAGAAGKPVILIGASIGANLALLDGADDAQVWAVALLSPGLDYKGLKTEEALGRYGDRPIFMAASADDESAAKSTDRLAELAAGELTLKRYQGAGHGTQMFGKEDGQPGDLLKSLVAWVEGVVAK
ncbi:MAG: alpha/beta fold hydrolase [Planctomycetes bacterium]|nr:alpha/beta fold hydrolase [Planctomycetota bacterium]